MRHIDSMSELRQAVGLQAYSQTNPLIVYQQEGRAMFEEMVRGMTEDTARYVLRATIEYNVKENKLLKTLQQIKERKLQGIALELEKFVANVNLGIKIWKDLKYQDY